MAKAEKKVIKRDNWISNFTLVGEVIINDYSFKYNEESESGFVYNQMNLGIDCGEEYGVIYPTLMGGYSKNNDTQIYVHGKDENGKDDFENFFSVSWEDRLDEDVIDEIGDFCFINVGIETTDKGKTFTKKFLSPYDAIEYIGENIKSGMVVNVKGNIKYSIYNDVVSVQKNIKSIYLSKAEKKDYRAVFTQSILIDKHSVNIKNIDKDKKSILVDGTVLDYISKYNDIEIKGNYPFKKEFEFEIDTDNTDLCKKVINKLFKVKKGYTQINFEGKFIEGGATIMPSIDDIPDDIKSLIDLGVYSEEDALKMCATDGNREYRMVLTRPFIRKNDEGIPVIQIFEEKYSEEDLILDYLNDNTDDATDNNKETKEKDFEDADEDDMDWLNQL